VTLRLSARAYLCGSKPDRQKAADNYAAAEKEAKKVSANVTLAEIYTEWAPLLWDTDINDAIDKLQFATAAGAQNPSISSSAKRNLSIALFKRGWRSMREGKSTDASADFERAKRDASVLKGTEALAFEFSLALANMDRGATAEANRLFKSLATRGNQAAYLRAPYASIGAPFFAAYANYRSGNPNLRQQAASDFARLQSQSSGSFSARLNELISSSWELVAFDHWRGGRNGQAGKALQSASQSADANMKRRIAVNRAALAMNAGALDELEALAGTPPEALVNAGIIYDQTGKPKEAYETWQKAKARGAQVRDLQKWIDAKKRIYGF
jgi:hypothetical protein